MDSQHYWTNVGSVGTLNQADLAKVSLHQSVIQLGVDLGPVGSTQAAAARASSSQPSATMPTIQAVVRYNVTAVEGLSLSEVQLYYLRILYRGQIAAKLMQVAIATGQETQLIPNGPVGFPTNPTLKFQELPSAQLVLDFLNNAYYVEATLIAPEQWIGNPAAISVVQLYGAPVFVDVGPGRAKGVGPDRRS